MAGRKHELKLQVSKATGEIRVAKDSGFDVVIVEPATGEIKVLNPRAQVILEKHEDGKITVKKLPNDRTKIEVELVDQLEADPDA